MMALARGRQPSKANPRSGRHIERRPGIGRVHAAVRKAIGQRVHGVELTAAQNGHNYPRRNRRGPQIRGIK